jgi:hypothetical protein
MNESSRLYFFFFFLSSDKSILHLFLQFQLLVELLKPNHENGLFLLDFFQLVSIDLDRAVFVSVGFEVTHQISDELRYDGPGLLLLNDHIQTVQLIPESKRELLQPNTRNRI